MSHFIIPILANFDNKDEFDRLSEDVKQKAEELQKAIQRLSEFQAEFSIETRKS